MKSLFFFAVATSVFLTLTAVRAEEYIRPTQPAGKVALVIGNTNYGGAARLRNPANDADAIAAALEELGFTVIKRKDADLDTMEDSFTEFYRSLNDGSVAFFYFAGHGVEVKGENYLVPVGAEIEEEIHVRRRCYSLADVLGVMESAKSNLNIVVLDCCRDNPLTRSWKPSWKRSSAGRGLAAIETVPEGTVVAFSTSPGETADDGEGNNSPFADHLAKTLRSRPPEGLKMREAFFRASREVKRQTGQRPYLEIEASLDEYFLVPAGNSSASQLQQPQPVEPAPDAPPMRPTPGNSGSEASFSGRLENTTWHLVDSDGVKCLIHFKSNGVLHYEGKRGLRKNGSWKLTNGKIAIEFNDGYTKLDGLVVGAKLKGKGVSVNSSPWTWEATIKR